jgi:hypothetical protein
MPLPENGAVVVARGASYVTRHFSQAASFDYYKQVMFRRLWKQGE